MNARYFIPPKMMKNNVRILLAGCGGSGSRLLSALGQLNFALTALGHGGLSVTVFDGDAVSEANIGRQMFSPADIGRNKAAVHCTRVNNFYGLQWQSIPMMLSKESLDVFTKSQQKYYENVRRAMQSYSSGMGDEWSTDILITAVDTVSARKEITSCISPELWLDLGNTKNTGQVILGTLDPYRSTYQRCCSNVPRGRDGKLLYPDAIDFLPTVFDLYPNVEAAEKKEYQGPSCSVTDALKKQDLFVNQWVAMMGSQLLLDALRHGVMTSHGMIVSLKTSTVRPLPVDPEMWLRMGAGTPKVALYKKAITLIKRRVTIANKEKAA